MRGLAGFDKAGAAEGVEAVGLWVLTEAEDVAAPVGPLATLGDAIFEISSTEKELE